MGEPENLEFHDFWIFETRRNPCGLEYTKLLGKYERPQIVFENIIFWKRNWDFENELVEW